MTATIPMLSTVKRSPIGLPAEIEGLLRAFCGLAPVKKLFWELLGYDRRDEVVSLEALGSNLRSSVIDARCFASHDKFHLYHLSLTGDSLTTPILRQLYQFFRRKHRFFALLVGNSSLSNWFFVYQADDLRSARSPGRVAIMRLGYEDDNIRHQSQDLCKLKTYDLEDEPLSLLEITTAYDGVFRVARPTTRETSKTQDAIGLLRSQIARYTRMTPRQERAVLVEIESIAPRQSIQRGNRIKELRVPILGRELQYKQLRDKLLVDNLWLCFDLSRKYAIDQEETLDLFQESVLGVLRAIDLVKPDKELRLSTYAWQWIRHDISRWIKNHRLLIRIPVHRYRLPEEAGRMPRCVPLAVYDNADEPYIAVDSIKSPSSVLESLERTRLIDSSLNNLKERSAEVIRLRFGLGGAEPHTLEEIGQSLGLTRERIRQIEDKALENLRYHLRDRLEDLT